MRLIQRAIWGRFRISYVYAAIVLVAAMLWHSDAKAADVEAAAALLKAGKYDECSAQAATAIEAGDYSETWRTLKLEADLSAGRYAEALVTLDAALQRFPSSVRLRWLGSRVCRFNGQDERAAKLLDEIDELMDGGSWRYTDPASRVALGEYYLHRGVDAKKVLDALFNQVKKRNPEYTPAYVASGRLALTKHDYGLAAEDFNLALKQDATDPDVYYGLAVAYAASDDERAEGAIATALERNPNHIDSLLFVASRHIDAERYDAAMEVLDHALTVNAAEPRMWAYRTVLAHLANKPQDEEHFRRLALGWWTTNPEVDFLVGEKLARKYRFAEAAAALRRSLQFQADYLPAQFELAQALLRLGEEDEGWKLAAEVYARDGYNVVAHNLVTLHDNLDKCRVLEGDGFLVRMDAREAEIYGHLVLDLLMRAKATLCPKYDMAIHGPIIVEIFPRQEDFAIRTFGLPGGAGFLGVCFGRVITANSPASQTAHPTNWQATLWHEFCHVVTLQKTQNKMPRWLSEGISVYEERQADKTWGQGMTPEYRAMILGTDLTPVSQLSGAFLSPPSPGHLQFAYYESSLVVQYLVEQYGEETLRNILVDLGAGLPINESLLRYAGSIETLDMEFAEYARDLAAHFAPQVDWTEPELPPNAPVEALAAWSAEHPNNFWSLRLQAAAFVKAERWDEAKELLTRLIDLCPEYFESGSAYELLAQVHRELNETEAEWTVLKRLSDASAANVAALNRLLELASTRNDWESTVELADKLLAVDPLQSAPHRYLAQAAEKTGDDSRSISALRALLQMDAIDPADLHYRLGGALQRTGQLELAKRETLAALEEAPRFRAAHRQLLEILRLLNENGQQPESSTEEKR